MRHFCLLLVLLLAAPASASAKTVTVPVGGKKTVKLTPQQVQFMRWFRAKTATVKRSPGTAQGSISTTKKTSTIKVRTVKVRTVKVRKAATGAKVVTIQVKPRPSTATAPRHHTVESVPLHRSSLGTLKAVLIEVPRPSTTSSTSVTVTSPRRQASRARTTRVTVTQVQGKRLGGRRNLRSTADRLVILQTPNAAGESAVPPISTLTALRLQLELSQME